MATQVRETDRGARQLEQRLAKMEGGVRITVGVHADSGTAPHEGSGGATVLDVATFLELGTEKSAPSSWLRAVLDEQRGQLGPALAQAAAEGLKSGAAGAAFARVADALAAAMRVRVSSERGQVRDAIEGRVEEAES